ncbi:MAG TPA: hypothetical protein IGR64_14905, partial [Leptolyngbyaceae cyanobacterium M65_K2018_010]|nr:hypothetical protein [Leptolyngbyaceae cyanobacterium M65_K2018_010]
MTTDRSERRSRPMGSMAKSMALILFGAGVATAGGQGMAALSALVQGPAIASPTTAL